ncbi:MAG: family 10 glycosylhydrolase [Paludibacteraceae bacterium]|nr:family 10 glycosylhydrolase [Paludibacteraceae bacterium]
MKKTIFTLLFAAAASLMFAAEPYFRAAWISTVANIDFPAKAAIGNYEQQQKDLVAMLDEFKAMNLNAIIFQVRPTADALYKSELEPWSHWLTGKQGEAATYDPLEFVCAEARKRGIDVHVWINPYRVTIPAMNIEDLAPNHMYHKHPEWFVKYGKQWYYAPHLQETRDFLCQVVADLVTRYDIQAIHMDDYFYPYPISGEEFPDAEAFAKDSRGFSDLGDWRRDNVNMAIEQVHNTIMSIKPEVQFGISPFGIWRNKANDPRGSETNGLQNYDQLYADILLWMEKGWIDYVVPQLYWEIGKKVADYEILAKWWAQYATDKCHVYIGMAPFHLGNPKGAAAWREGNEICRQLRLNKTVSGITGECYFRACDLLDNRCNLTDSLKQVFYPTYVPAPRK